MAWGIWRSSVLVPADADSWPAHRVRVVLLHELAHVKRRDCLTHLVAQLACAAYWFNPLVWMAARRLRTERERACDDLVLASGTRGSDYADQLLDIARVMQAGRFPAVFAGASLAMAQRSQLEGRLIAILDPSVPRRGLSRARAAAAAAIFTHRDRRLSRPSSRGPRSGSPSTRRCRIRGSRRSRRRSLSARSNSIRDRPRRTTRPTRRSRTRSRTRFRVSCRGASKAVSKAVSRVVSRAAFPEASSAVWWAAWPAGSRKAWSAASSTLLPVVSRTRLPRSLRSTSKRASRSRRRKRRRGAGATHAPSTR